MNAALEEAVFRRILQMLLEKRGVDFNDYRRTFLQRRLDSRIHALNLRDILSYENMIESHPEELNELFDTLTINVAEFFRDPSIWEYLVPNIFIPLIKRGKSLRVWSAGCASGEEPYSVAIAIKEITRGSPVRGIIKIVASDVDPLAIQRALSGIYGANALGKISQQRLKIFFNKIRKKGMENCFEVVPEIKSMVKFTEHNYLEPSPSIERADLILCRNSMIYLKTEAKNKAVANFYNTLAPGGHLILGVTEVLIGEVHYGQFQTIREYPGIFQKRLA